MSPVRRFARHVALAVAAGLALFSRTYAAGPIQLTDVTRQTGIKFVHTDGGSGRRYIIETVSAGLALFDYDLDWDVDIYFLNGAPLKGTKYDTVPRHALYRNDGDFHFTDVTEEAGIGNTGYGLGVTVGDYDEDGDGDLYLNNFGPNVLYRNNGDGTFDNVTIESSTGNGHQVGAGANFLDVDKDSDLDLFVGNYLEFSYEAVGPVTRRGVPAYPTPEFFPLCPMSCFLTIAMVRLPTLAANRASLHTRVAPWEPLVPTTTMTEIPTSLSPTTPCGISSSRTTAPESSPKLESWQASPMTETAMFREIWESLVRTTITTDGSTSS